MAKKNIHIVPNGNQWEVKPEGLPPVSKHRTQGAAEEAGRRLAKQAESELITHRPNGQIRNKDSFGNDPNPPRDRKH